MDDAGRVAKICKLKMEMTLTPRKQMLDLFQYRMKPAKLLLDYLNELPHRGNTGDRFRTRHCN